MIEIVTNVGTVYIDIDFQDAMNRSKRKMEQDKIIELPSGESMFIDWESVIIIREVSESLQVIPIENLNLPSRIVDILYDNDIKTVEELSSLSDDDLKKMRGVGGATLKIIKNALQEIA